MVAAQIARVTGGGYPFRYGGEEFTVVFPGKKVDDVASHLEKIRNSVESTGFAMRKQDRPKSRSKGRKGRGNNKKPSFEKVGVTISIGAASKDARTSKPEQVLKRADLALYKAKQSGRNRVVSFNCIP